MYTVQFLLKSLILLERGHTLNPAHIYIVHSFFSTSVHVLTVVLYINVFVYKTSLCMDYRKFVLDMKIWWYLQTCVYIAWPQHQLLHPITNHSGWNKGMYIRPDFSTLYTGFIIIEQFILRTVKDHFFSWFYQWVEHEIHTFVCKITAYFPMFNLFLLVLKFKQTCENF